MHILHGVMNQLTTDDLIGSQRILEQNCGITELIVSTPTGGRCTRPETVDRYQTTEEDDGDLYRLLFSHCRSKNAHYCKACFSTLVLDNFSLVYAQRTYLQVIEFEKLRTLTLRETLSADHFLAALGVYMKKNGAALTAFACQSYYPEAFDSAALSSFLVSFSGLQHLDIHLQQCMHEAFESSPVDALLNEEYDLRGINAHAETLQSLFLCMSFFNRGYRSGWYIPPPEVQQICRTCKSLERLALAFPETTMTWVDNAEDSDYSDYVVSSFMCVVRKTRGLTV
jgi:hypothetical protein